MAIDYAELAKKSGAVSSEPPKIDYGAMAKQSGAISSTAPSVTAPSSISKQIGSVIGNVGVGVAKEAGKQLLNIGGMIRSIPMIGPAIEKVAPDPLKDISRAKEGEFGATNLETGEQIKIVGGLDEAKRYQDMGGWKVFKIGLNNVPDYSMFSQEGQEKIGLEPKGLPQKIGATGLDVAEYFAPGSMIAKTGKALAATSAATKLGTAGEVVAKAIPEVASAMGVAKVQGQDNVGAAGLLAAGTPIYNKALNVAGKNLPVAIAERIPEVQLSPRQMLFKALKPINRNLKFEGDMGKAVPEIYEQAKLMGKKIENLDDFIAVTKEAKKRIWKPYEDFLGKTKASISGDSIADAMVRSIPERMRLKDPSAVKAIEEFAEKAYRGKKLSLQEAEDFLQNVNAETEAYYALFPRARVTKAEANAGLGASLAEGDALRKAIYQKIDMISGAKPSTLAKTKTPINAQKIKETYGALINMENEAYRRVNVAKRLAPESLTEQLGMLKAAGKFAFAAARGSASGGAAALAEAVATRAAARIIKERNTSDYLLKKAMADYGTYVEKLRKGQRFAIAVPAALNQMTGNP